VIVVHNSARGKQLTAGRSSRPLALPFARCEPEFLTANDNPTRIVILPVLRNEGSDQRESKGLSSRSLPPKPSPSSLPWLFWILIANLELGFHISPIRITELRFSNRKYSQLFHSPWRIAKGSQATCPRRSNSNSRITEKELSRTKERRKQNSNSNKIAFSANSASHAFSRQTSAVSEPLSCSSNLAIIEFPTRGDL
jgi:hypothetical protein